MLMDFLIKVLSHHPKYMEHFLQTHNAILRGDGPLSYPYRYIIAIIVRFIFHSYKHSEIHMHVMINTYISTIF
jgi:hypothetical protein